jgi:hypothetical protein
MGTPPKIGGESNSQQPALHHLLMLFIRCGTVIIYQYSIKETLNRSLISPPILGGVTAQGGRGGKYFGCLPFLFTEPCLGSKHISV